MSLKNKVTAFGLSAVMLLSPAASLAESNYAAGELTTTAISDSYVAGNQLNLSAGFRLELGDVVKSLSDEKLEKKLDAVVSLMEATELHMSFYDDFGTARIHAEIETDGLTIFSADALAYAAADGKEMTDPNVIIEDGVCKMADHSSLAGSIATMDVLVRTMVKAGIPLADAVRMASELSLIHI